ncbi:MAG: NUDIX domain-containing protein [Bacteroidia bacterium]|nr:NUDIX domain-containing protein [Bacteroidia bacterium]
MTSNFPDNKYPFNVRVYGICFNEKKELLIADELIKGREITKFPGGGLEYGEGPADCIVREFREETGNDVQVIRHVYTTDFFVQSAFGNNQVISIYYEVKMLQEPRFTAAVKPFDFVERKEGAFVLRWLKRDAVIPGIFTFPIDKKVAELLR